MLTVIRFRAEAAPRRLRTQSLYLTQVMREAARANLSAANSSPVSRYGLFTRLSLHTNELFNNSVGQRNKLSAESCGNSSGADEDLTSGTAVFVFTGSTQLRSAAGSSFYTPKGSSTGRNENFFPICMFAGKIQNLKGAEGQFLVFHCLIQLHQTLINQVVCHFYPTVVLTAIPCMCRKDLDETLKLLC